MVSVIVPVYNAEKHLKSCVESVLSQNYTDIELLLVDDGSVDNSALICKAFSDSRIRYVYKDNGGVSSARNLGLSMANGEFVTFLDADDYLPNGAISKLVEPVKKNEADISVGSYLFLYEDNTIQHSSRLTPGNYILSTLLSGFIDDGTLSGFLLGNVWGTLYKTSIIKNNNLHFNTSVKNNEDGLFNFEYAICARRLKVISDCIYVYRQYYGNSSSKRLPDYDFNKLIVDRLNELNWDKDRNKYSEQLKARNVSLALWDVLLYSKQMSFRDGVSFISNRIGTGEVREGICYLNYKKMTRYKRVFAYLIKYRMSVFLFWAVKYVVPFLDSRVSR